MSIWLPVCSLQRVKNRLKISGEKQCLVKVTVDLRGVSWGKQYSALCINGKYINLYIIGELI